MPDTPHIVFAGGGTAGHLFPGLAVAHYLAYSALRPRITFVGTGKSFERAQVETAGFDYRVLRSRPFPSRAGETIRFLADNLSGFCAARRFFREHAVSLVVGSGGYASVAATRAAARRQIPVLLLEPNAMPGKATRWLAGDATLVCAAFEEVRDHLPQGCRVRLTGTPIRREFLECPLPKPATDAAHRSRLVILGGSGGARQLNECGPWAVHKARESLADWQIVHQTGQRDATATRALYRRLGIAATVAPFFEDLASILRTSDLAISRAGGSTLAELAVCGVPAILLPYPHASDDHQRQNAEPYCRAGAARLLETRELKGRLDNHLARVLSELASDAGLRLRMADSMQRLATPTAAERVAQLVSRLLPSEHARAA